MTPERVLPHLPLVLDQRMRERYFEEGFLTVPGYVGAAWLDRLRAVVAAKIEESRRLAASDDQFDLAPDHSAEKPNIRRMRQAGICSRPSETAPSSWLLLPFMQRIRFEKPSPAAEKPRGPAVEEGVA